ncbi:hypothetical protein AAHA92_34048 [Salvia divinorum]|uniref:Uncharacterized protein n=1 Tax=Salvia divinorum TaxID=28513 RepID=A0ABD1FIN0_SALDI
MWMDRCPMDTTPQAQSIIKLLQSITHQLLHRAPPRVAGDFAGTLPVNARPPRLRNSPTSSPISDFGLQAQSITFKLFQNLRV